MFEYNSNRWNDGNQYKTFMKDFPLLKPSKHGANMVLKLVLEEMWVELVHCGFRNTLKFKYNRGQLKYLLKICLKN